MADEETVALDLKKHMRIKETKENAQKLLDNYYQIHTLDLPTKRPKSQWQAENKRGFFLGIIQEGEDSHIIRLHDLLVTDQFTPEQEFSTTSQLADPQHLGTFIDELFAYYILPFHKVYTDASSCHTPPSSNPPSRSNSVEDFHYIPHKDLKKAVEERDGVCLFCWDREEGQAAHIIAQNDLGMAYEESSLLLRAGLTQKHQVQNGMLLCIKCHSKFDKLQWYVDVVDDKLVVKVVNYSVLRNDEKHMEWRSALMTTQAIRTTQKTLYWNNTGRQAIEPNGEMALYFVLNNPTLLPNRDALEFHKTACLIWRMAGGGEPDEEYCPDNDDEYVSVDYRVKDIQKWRQESSVTLNAQVD